MMTAREFALFLGVATGYPADTYVDATDRLSPGPRDVTELPRREFVVACSECGARWVHADAERPDEVVCDACGGGPAVVVEEIHAMTSARNPKQPRALPGQTHARRPYWPSFDGPGRPTAGGVEAPQNVAEAA